MAGDDRRQGAEDRPSAPDLHRRARPRLRSDRSSLVATWTLTVRAGPKVERRRFDTLEHALAALEARVAEITEYAESHPADTKLRRYGPERQVVARIELSGPQRQLSTVHAGIDVRGDGSTEPYLGRVRRRPIRAGHGEDAAATIRTALLDR